MLRVFIGVDRYEMVAYHVLSHSIMRHASKPVAIIPVYKHNLKDILWRERDPLQSTDFAFSRFLVPHLSDYEGVSVFMDCDMLVKCDINELSGIIFNQPEKSVWCVKHSYIPNTKTKFLKQEQTIYRRKNWSSLMVFNNSLCDQLTPNYVNGVGGLALHQFNWLEHDSLIGELPATYNWLVGEYKKNNDAKILHFTQGTPCFSGYALCDHWEDWYEEKERINSCVQKIRQNEPALP